MSSSSTRWRSDFARSSARGGAARKLAEAAGVADTCIKAFTEGKKQFLARPTEALGQEMLAHLQKARAAYASVAEQYPDHPQGAAAAQYVRSLDDEIRKFQDVIQLEARHSAARAKIQEVDKALEAEIARRLERGGDLDVEAWRKRYQALER